MADSCSVPGCQSIKATDSVKTFHKFPSNKVMARLWEAAIKTKVSTSTQGHHASDVVCSDHFWPEDFRPKSAGRVTLRPEAIPKMQIQPPVQNTASEDTHLIFQVKDEGDEARLILCS